MLYDNTSLSLFLEVSLFSSLFTEKNISTPGKLTHIRNLMVSENKALLFNFSKKEKKLQKTYIFLIRKD